MRSIMTLCFCLLSSAALAHIKLTSPGSFQVTDASGGPNKSEPCGEAGVATGVVTTVEAGSQLTVTWTEPIPHPGHFRIGIATDPAQFVTPTAVINANNCVSAPIASPVAYPTLVDGLFPHIATQGPYTTTVTVPMMSCANCRLQLMQFMASHAPPCFYYQCATLRIVMPDAGQPVPDAGTLADAGTGGGGGGAGGGTASGGSATGGSGGSSGTCDPTSCAGCCVQSRCEAGTTEAACGVGGALCSACSGATACEMGTCAPAPAGCGCTSAPFGGLALALGLWALRRSRR